MHFQKHNGIEQFYYEHVSQRCGKAESISIWQSTPTSLLCPPHNISIKDSEGSMLVSAHASTVYAVW